jgi:plastocyanin
MYSFKEIDGKGEPIGEEDITGVELDLKFDESNNLHPLETEIGLFEDDTLIKSVSMPKVSNNNKVNFGNIENYSPDKNYTIKYRTTYTVLGEDEKEIVEDWRNADKYFKLSEVDTTPAVITIEPYETNWTNKDVVVKAKVDKGTLNSASHTFTENGSFTFVATTDSGIKTEKEVTISNIDKVKPILELTQEPKGLTSGKVTITVKASDTLSGAKEIVLPDGTKVAKSEATYTIDKNGTYTFKAVDKAGNETEKSIEVTNIDVAPAVITIEPYETNWTNKDVVVKAKVDKGTLNNASHTFTENGSFTFVATTDSGIKTEKEVTISNIDKVKPTIPSIQKGKDRLTLIPGVDKESGISKHIYSINDGQWKTFDKEILTSSLKEGICTINVKAVDKAGNESKTYSDSFMLKNKEIVTQDKLEETAKRLVQEARELVEFAEDEKTTSSIIIAQDKIDTARKVLNILENEDLKGALTKELDELQTRLDSIQVDTSKESDAYKKALEAVEKAEKYKSNAHIRKAQGLIDKLPEGEGKNYLQDRLDALREELNPSQSSAENKALKAVEKAEKYRSNAHIRKAQGLVDELPEGTEKDELQERLDKLKVETGKGKSTLLEAEEAVEKAEKYGSNAHIRRAQRAINELPESNEKVKLQERLDSLKSSGTTSPSESQHEEALEAIEKAEKYKSNAHIRKAQEAINKLPASEEKLNLQKRLDALK